MARCTVGGPIIGVRHRIVVSAHRVIAAHL
jgi:hypothetical protein